MPRFPRLRSISPWIWTSLLFTLLAVGVQFLPLTRELHYELSAVAALWTSIGVGLAALVAWWRRGDEVEPASATVRALGAAIFTTIPPLLVSIAHTLLSGACGSLEGILWYLLLAPPSAVITVAVARLARAMTRRRWLQVVLFLLLWGAPMVRGAFEALNGPHIYLYAWQIGFFPGGSWDPELPITPLLLLYRIAQVLIACLLLLVLAEIEAARTASRRRGVALVLPAALAGAIVVALLPLRSEIGLTRTDTWLRAALGDSVRTRFTMIYYDATSTDSLDIWRAANYADFYVWRQARALGIGLDRVEPITFYAYASSGEQKRLVGTSSASFTKPWRRTLNLSFDRVEATLEHELAHIVLEPYGNILGVSWSNGILEGAAVALEHVDDAPLLHRRARAARDLGLAGPVTSVMSATGFASQRASLSYLMAGSFCRWLIDTYGAERFLRAYASGSLEEDYARRVDTLAAAYDAFLSTITPADPELEPTVRSLYGGGSFFLQRCLRRTATLSGEGYRALGEERYDEALERFGASLELGITVGARAGVVRTLHAAGRYQQLVDSMALYLGRDSLGPQMQPLLVELSDAMASVGGDRAAVLEDVLRGAGDEWTRVRAALRLLFTGSHNAGSPIADPIASAMLEYFRRPMSLVARTSMLLAIERMHGDSTTTGRSDGDGFALDADRRRLLVLMRANQQVRSTPLMAVSAVLGDAHGRADSQLVASGRPDGASSTGTAASRLPASKKHRTGASSAHAAPSRSNADTTVVVTSPTSIDPVSGFARSALLRTLNDAYAMSIWADGLETADERRRSVRWIDDAYRYLAPRPRADWPRELVLAERPVSTFVGFLQYLHVHGAIATPRARR